MPPLARGEAVGAFALTEPGSGSDAGSLRTRADSDGDGWRITGSKQWITNGSFGGTVVLFARTDPATAGARGVSCFVLDGEHVRVTREEEKLGLNSSIQQFFPESDPRRAASKWIIELRKMLQQERAARLIQGKVAVRNSTARGQDKLRRRITIDFSFFLLKLDGYGAQTLC